MKGNRTTSRQRDRGDLLRFRPVAFLLGSPAFVTSLQLVTLTLFIIAIYKGFTLPEKEENLFTTGLFWGLFWPFFIFIITPVFGKIFCGICPHRLIIFSLGSRFGLGKKPPKWVNSGYISLAIVLLFYWLPIYASPGIFHSPLNTAIYFSLFTLIAALFSLYYSPKSWCKGVCPVALPTNLVSKVAFVGVRTYKEGCKTCKKATCFTGREGIEGCPHGINPSKLQSNADCTLCMKCITACSHDAIRLGTLRPFEDFKNKMRKADMPGALGTILLFGALTLTMQLYNGIYKGAMKESFPLARLAAYFQPFVDFAISREGLVALTTFLFSLSFILGYYLLFSFLAGKKTGKGTAEPFELFAWTLLPVFALSSFSQMGEFFSFRYYPMMADAFFDLFGLAKRVMPLAQMNSIWLSGFKFIAIGGAIWSMVFAWRASGSLTDLKSTRIMISLPFWLLYLFVMSGFIAHMIVMIYLDIPEVTGPRH